MTNTSTPAKTHSKGLSILNLFNFYSLFYALCTRIGEYTEEFVAKYLTPYIPDSLVRMFIRHSLKGRVVDLQKIYAGLSADQINATYIAKIDKQKIAIETEKANEQHYMVPTSFFKLVMGDCMKYSAGEWTQMTNTLTESETYTLDKYCDMLGLNNGTLRVLDIGCGWGSFSLYASQKYPSSDFVCVSNSSSQREYIEDVIRTKKITNLKVHTVDINDLTMDTLGSQFDRIISVEMFEHVKNHRELFKKISSFLKPSGKMLVHIFSHDKYCYDFENDSWMGRNFFSGGTMPSSTLLISQASECFKLESHTRVDGKHYERTCNEWLKKMDSNKDKVLRIFEETYRTSDKSPTAWYMYWRLFFLACAECFGYNEGREWYVNYYLFNKI
ncbi:class I SAM-dependent methyltransferase [Yasminevirus sp. GU-2018]|uniref:Class I SAM-dependent methyltransferase n=1 Tax=Yasminevirus sp. GU-2018 TaxID=2420051 RepID=A0A5K0U9F5_9VIRU|nr:class I SAM-dependent methyltransferase [Yasminevirus sp. GU-2018]